jgi:hypothetical protein
MTLPGVEFLRRFLLHVLPTHFTRIRYYGLLASRSRAKNIARCRELLAADTSTTPSTPSEPKPDDDRDLCPCCGIGRLRDIGTLSPIAALDLNDWAPLGRDTS